MSDVEGCQPAAILHTSEPDDIAIDGHGRAVGLKGLNLIP